MYAIHPSKELRKLFKNKPYQGQDPIKAKVLFMGLDANFGPNIETDGIYPYIKEYLSDGVKFWKERGVHHPFLLKAYPSSDGVRYHKQFSKLGLNSNHAQYISFIELLDVPTVARTNKNEFRKLLNLDYLNNLDEIFNSNERKLLFISSGVLRELREIKKAYRIFNWIPEREIKGRNEVIEVYDGGGLKVCFVTHFSASISDDHIMDIRRVIDEFSVDYG